MPIQFTVNEKENYFTAKWDGLLSDTELIPSYEYFFNSKDWHSGLNELADLSTVDFSEISCDAIVLLSRYAKTFYISHDITVVKTATYCIEEAGKGFAKIYDIWTKDSPEYFRIFNDKQKAIFWLTNSGVQQELQLY